MVDYCDKKLGPYFTSVSAYQNKYMISKDHCASVSLSTADVEYLWNVVCTDVTLSKLRSLLPEARYSELAAVAVGECRQYIRRAYVAV